MGRPSAAGVNGSARHGPHHHEQQQPLVAATLPHHQRLDPTSLLDEDARGSLAAAAALLASNHQGVAPAALHRHGAAPTSVSGARHMGAWPTSGGAMGGDPEGPPFANGWGGAQGQGQGGGAGHGRGQASPAAEEVVSSRRRINRMLKRSVVTRLGLRGLCALCALRKVCAKAPG